jgi:hypothetical protein
MVKGAPDYTKTFTEIGYIGQGLTAYSISGDITGESAGYLDLPAAATNTENYYVYLVASVNDDEAIHRITLTRVSDSHIFFDSYFKNKIVISLPTVSEGAAETVRITFYNNHTSTLTFKSVIYWVTRPAV